MNDPLLFGGWILSAIEFVINNPDRRTM